MFAYSRLVLILTTMKNALVSSEMFSLLNDPWEKKVNIHKRVGKFYNEWK